METLPSGYDVKQAEMPPQCTASTGYATWDTLLGLIYAGTAVLAGVSLHSAASSTPDFEPEHAGYAAGLAGAIGMAGGHFIGAYWGNGQAERCDDERHRYEALQRIRRERRK